MKETRPVCKNTGFAGFTYWAHFLHRIHSLGCFTASKGCAKSLKCIGVTNFSDAVRSTEYENGQKSWIFHRLGVARRPFSFSSKTMEVNVGQDVFSKFDYQKLLNGSQNSRTTFLGSLAPLNVKNWVQGEIS